MNGWLLLIPFFAVRFLLPAGLNRHALQRAAYFAPIGSQERGDALDFLYYLWCGKHSPLFGKSKMASFERTFLEDKATRCV